VNLRLIGADPEHPVDEHWYCDWVPQRGDSISITRDGITVVREVDHVDYRFTPGEAPIITIALTPATSIYGVTDE
jgi:hypothetical protein